MIFDTAINIFHDKFKYIRYGIQKMRNNIKISPLEYGYYREYSKWSLVARSSCICMMLKTIKSTVLCTISSYDNTAIIIKYVSTRDWSEIVEILRFKINLAISFIQKNPLECIG